MKLRSWELGDTGEHKAVINGFRGTVSTASKRLRNGRHSLHRHLFQAEGAVGGPAGCRSTQVSLDPPPCEEFTTSDPLRNATRVNPPGLTEILSP
jgi:hypothetical protein